MPTPPLKNVRKSNPYRPVFDDMSRAIRDQSVVQSGPGFGVTTSPFGRMIRQTSQNYMMAMTDGTGIDVAKPVVFNNLGAGITLAKGFAYEQTIGYDGDDVRIVPSFRGPGVIGDDATLITCYNMSEVNPVRPFKLVNLVKRFGLWLVEDDAPTAVARAVVTIRITSGTFAAVGGGEAQIYHMDATGNWTASGDPVTVLNQHALPNPIPVGGAIHIANCDGSWFLITTDCP